MSIAPMVLDDSGTRRLVTRTEYARMRGVEFAAVRGAVLSGRIHLVDGKIDPEVADREWAENTAPEKGGGMGLARKGQAERHPSGTHLTPNGAVTFHAVRTQHEQLRLELARAELEERRGNLVSVEDVKHAAFAEGRRVRDAVLRVPGQVASALAAATSPADCRRLLNNALRAALAPRKESGDGLD